MGDNLEVLVTETGYIDERITDGDKVRPGCLGRLGGPIADWGEGTRNGRYYSRDLWVKVFDTPWVQEALETKTLFGEADHPDERLESKISEAAVVMTDYEFRDDEELLYGWFDILDTPSGRILRTLADYGSKLGVSSRGRGEVIKQNGKQVVKESSYLFGGFDIVALPAVKKARQDFVLEGSNLRSSIEEQIEDCRSLSELTMIRNVLESSEIDNLDEYVSLIENKENEFGARDNAIIEKLTNDLQKSYSDLNRIKHRNGNRKANTISEEIESTDKNNVELFTEMYDENSQLKSELIIRDKQTKKVKEVFDKLYDKVNSLSRKSDKQAKANERLRASHATLEEENADLHTKLRELSLKSKSDLRDYNKLVDSYNDLLSESEELSKEYTQAVDSYLELKCSQHSSIDYGMARRLLPENYTVNDIDNVIDSQIKLQKRMTKLPISSPQLERQAVLEGYPKRDAMNSNNEEGSLKDLQRMLETFKKG